MVLSRLIQKYLIVKWIDSSQILFPGCRESSLVDHTSTLNHCITGLLQVLQTCLLMDILGRLTQANTSSHDFMRQDGGILNQLTPIVLLKKMTAWVQQELSWFLFLDITANFGDKMYYIVFHFRLIKKVSY